MTDTSMTSQIFDKARHYRCFIGLSFCVLSLLFVTGCTTPVGVTRQPPDVTYENSYVNPIGKGVLSNIAKPVLHRYNLLKTFDDEPERVISFLNEVAVRDGRRDIHLTLAELTYLYGTRLRKSFSSDDRDKASDFFLLSAVYSYLYLLEDGKESPSPYDLRFREACDFYNRALWQAFSRNDGGEIQLQGGTRKLLAGSLDIALKPDKLFWPLDAFETFQPADAYDIHGFTVRNRAPGIGLPLIGLLKKSPENPNGGGVPLTAFLRVSGGLDTLADGAGKASLEIYSAFDEAEVQINGRSVPLEADTTAPLAYRLNDSTLWDLGVKRFLAPERIKESVLFLQPYEPGRIPVVFVHGTASSPVWWTEMLNTLRADPYIRKYFQFWFFQYNSSALVLLSAAELRDSLTDMVKQLDPQGKDPALRRMVLVGHSQGGLLTKTAAVDPGDRLWKGVSDESFDEALIDDDVREIARRAYFFKPLPFVKRVVFISTPHRGSFLSKGWIRSLISKLVSFPIDILTFNTELLNRFTEQLNFPPSMRKIPTSIDSMSAENPNLQSLARLPLAPGVTGHSIIAVLPDMDIETGNDGVVEYKSAHIEDMASEFIVRSDHSCQSHPFTIEEVRRILMEHAGMEVPGPSQLEPVPAQPPAPETAPGPATAAQAAR